MLEKGLTSYQGFIFDFDGTLFLTENVIERCWEKVAQEEGKNFSHDLFLQGGGLKDAVFIQNVLRWTHEISEIERIKVRKETIYLQALSEENIQIAKGAKDFLLLLQEQGIPCAIASSSIRKNIDMILSHYSEIRKFFSVIVSSDDVLQGKPDPTVFLLAASRLGVDPSLCIVFEDAVLGIEAGRRAGMYVIGVASTRNAEELEKANPDRIISDFSELV